ncbi:unnamed protein product [Acanthoscelides obtectus]|nr:unnamed protein product [Acanthoscelides obtectus]CAK1642558.1 hypothetical protein AOBTE_LOCUS13116 [Acanthoscelides obtectus]
MEVTPRECQADGVQTVSIEKPLGEMSGVNEKEHIVQKPAASVGHLGSVMNTIEEKSKASVLRPQGTIIDRTADYVGTCFSGFANEREIEEGEIVSDEESHVEENIASSEHTNTSVMKYCSQHDETANWKKAQGGLIDTSRIMKNVQTQGTVLDLTEKVSVFGDNDLEEGEIVSDEEHHIDQNSASSKYKSISEIKDSSQKGSPGIMKKYVAKETIDITDRIEAHVTSFAFKGKIHLGQGHEGKFSAASNHRKTAMKARSRSSSAGKIIDVADANLVDEVECSKSDLTSFRRDTSKATTDLIHNSKSVHVNGENKQDIDREGISKSNENFPIISDKPISGQPVGTHSDLFTDYLFNYVELLETTDSSDCECLPPQLDELKKLPLEVITKQLLKNFKKWTKKMERETKQRINTPANIGHTTRPISIEPTPIFVPSFILEKLAVLEKLPVDFITDDQKKAIIYWQKLVDRRNQIENSDNVEILEIHKTEKRGDEIAALAKSRVKTQRTEVGMQSTASTEDTTVDPISDLSDYLRKKLAKLKRRTDLTRKQRKRMKRWGRLLDDHQVSYVSEQVIESSSYLNMPETSVKKTEELLENCQGYQHTNSLLGPISKEASSCIENKLNTVETVSDSIAESAESVVKSADTHSQSNSAEAVEWLQPSINSTEKPLEAEATLESFTSAKDLTSLFSAFEAVATDGTKESSVLCQSLPAESAVDGYFLDKSVISAPKQAETCSQFVFAEKDGLLEDESVHTQNILESEGVASNSGDKSSVSADTYSECGTADAARPRQELMTCIENMSRSAINSYFVDKSADAYSQFVCAKSDRPLEKMSGCIENITKTADANSSVDRSESFLVITKVTDSLIDPVQVDGPIQELSIVPESAENNSDSVEYIAVCVSAGSKDIDSQFGSPKSSCTEHIPNSGNGTPTDEVNSSMQNLLVADIYSHFGSTEATESPENVSCSVEMSQVCENLDSTDIASVQFDKMLGKSSNSTESISELIEHIPRQVSSDFSKFPSLLIFGQSILKEKIEKPHHHFGFVMADRQSGEVSGCAATSLHLINSKSIDAIESQEISTTSSIYVGQSSTFAQLSSVNAAKQVPEEVVGVTAKPMPRQDQASSVTEKLTATVSGNTSTIGIEQARRKRRHDDDGGAEDPGNTKRQRTREPLFPLRVAIVDQQYPDVVLTLDQSEAIEAELVDRVVKTPDYHGAVALQFNNCSYAGGVLWICCANNYTKIWLQMTISHLCRFWKDLWLKAVDEVDLPRRPKVMVFVPGKEPAVDEFRLGLCKDNPGLTVKYWLLIGRKTEEARGSVLAFSIDTRSYEMLENNAWTMSYKKSTLRCKVMKKINDLWEETFAQEHFASTCGTAKAKDSRKKKEKGYPSSSRD